MSANIRVRSYLPRFCSAIAAALAWAGLVAASPAIAAEPASEFLDGLRNKGYYDMAVLYLDRMENSPLVSTAFKRVLPYEKGVTLADASRREYDFARRAQMIDDANVALTRFVKENPRHKFTAAANNQLGNLLVEQARMLIEKSEKPSGAAQKPQLLKDARAMFDKANAVFTGAKETIARELKGIRPNLDPTEDAEEIEYRDELRKGYLQAQLTSAAVLEEKAEVARADKKEYEELLKQAAAEYNEIYETYRVRIAGLYARLYQGRCFQKIAEHEGTAKADADKYYQDALSFYTFLLEQPDDPPPFRTLKTKTLLLAIDSWIATGKTDAAVNRGLEWMDKVRPVESNDLEWIELRLKLARALKTHADKETDATQKRQFLKDARELAKFVASTSTDYKQDAQKLLLALGVGDEPADGEMPVAKSFMEAKEYGKEALDRMTSSDFAVKNLPPRIKSEKDAGIKAELEKQLAEAKEAVVTNRKQALEYYNQALGMADPETPTDDVNVVRYFLCYLNYVEENYFRSAVLGEFIARRYPNSAGAKPSSKIAMAAYLKLYKLEEKGQRDFETRQAVGIARYITERWPDAPEAIEALNTLIPFMIQAGDLQQAMDYVAKVPVDSPVRGEAELKTGQAMWSRYLTENFELRKAVQAGNPPADMAAREAELEQLKGKAQEVLSAGVARMRQTGEVDSTMATAVLSLAQVYVDLGQPEKAVPLLEDEKVGALRLVLQKHPATERPGFATETYRIALRAYIGTLPTAEDPDTVIKMAKGVMQNLRTAMGDDAEGSRKLVAIYMSLAQDLEKQLEISDEQSKQALSKGFETFLTEVMKSADRFDVLNWVAETFYSLGKGFDTGKGVLSDQAKGYYGNAITTYEKILANYKADPSFLPEPKMELQVQNRMAMVLRRIGNYAKAIAIFTEILRENKTALNFQVEAALTFQEWAEAANDNSIYLKAMQGDVKGPDGKDVIWGWGQLSQVTARYPKRFIDVFHDSRYNLALSSYRMAGNSKTNEEKMKYLDRAKKFIVTTHRLYPELGGEERMRQYNSLLKVIQTALGEKYTELKPPAPQDAPAPTANAAN